MKRYCTVCNRKSIDGNLWCQKPQCPAGNMPLILDYGEWLGDIEIVRLVRPLRSAAVYEARRDGEMVLLKVAHDHCQDQLRREAVMLAKLAAIQQHPMLPVLLPAYKQADVQQRPYGKTVFHGETKYYTVFAHSPGSFLSDLLLKNPQPWYLHAVWLTVSLADVIAFLHLKGEKLHLNLNPDGVYVRIDKAGLWRPMLLDLGLLSDPGSVEQEWVTRYCVPAYTAPEVLSRSREIGHASDIYGLGLILYQMLAGEPPYTVRDLDDAEIRNLVLAHEPPPLNRTDLAADVQQIVQMAIHRQPGQRQQDVRALAKMLRMRFGEVPAEKKRSVNRQLAITATILALVMVLLIVMSALLT